MPTRRIVGTASARVSTHLPPISGSNVLNPVVFPPGLERLSTKPAPTGSVTTTNTIGTVVFSCLSAARPDVPFTTTTSGRSGATSFACTRAIWVLRQPARFDRGILTIDPTGLPQAIPKKLQPLLAVRIILTIPQNHGDTPNVPRLLTEGELRPNYRARQRSKSVPSPHSITSSARARRRLRHCEAKGSRRFEVDRQLNFRCLMDGQVSRSATLEDLT